MSIRHRIDAAERKAGGGQEPTILYLFTVYEDRNGDADRTDKTAILFRQPGESEFIKGNDGEGREAFMARVQARCLSLFGRLPSGEKRIRIPEAT